MANDEVLGPRKTMFILVIVVGCFAILWPRILSPLIVGHTKQQLQPNQFDRDAAVKQERSAVRGAGPHPALRERGRAIPPGAPAPSRSSSIQMPPNVRVRSPLQGYFELDIKPPPIPGMRPPLGSPGGPQAAPKSSMGLVMPIYTLCIIIFFVYTLSKIFFKSTAEPYEPVSPDPQFRKRVFRDDSRTTPDKLVVSAISGLVAEVRQQMETGYAQNQQTQERQDNTRPYTNGTVLHNSGPVHIIASEYQKESFEKEPTPENKVKAALDEVTEEIEDAKEIKDDKEIVNVTEDISGVEVRSPEDIKDKETKEESEDIVEEIEPEKEVIPEKVEDKLIENLVDLTETEVKKNGDIQSKVTADFIEEAKKADDKKTKELLEEALDDEEYENEEEEDIEPEKSSVKVVGMEVRAESADGGAFPAIAQPPAPVSTRSPHEADEVKSIFLDTEIPQKSRVLVDFSDDTPRDSKPPARHSPMVVSGKMTLSLIQDAPRDTPERDVESTVDDFTTASALTQDAAENEGSDSEEEVEEEIEEIEEEVEEEIEEEEVETKEVKEKEVAKKETSPAEDEEIEEEEEIEVEEEEVEEEDVELRQPAKKGTE